MLIMNRFFEYLQEFNMLSISVRLLLAVLFGGVIGFERGKKRRAAGFRTYILVCLGAALTMLLGQYEYTMLITRWSDTGMTMDVARFGAQVINGIGFLGAGTVIVTGKQQVKGLTTAAGLWACACMGLAIGAGFFECCIIGFLSILVVVQVLPAVEAFILVNARNLNIYVEFDSLQNIGKIINFMKEQKVQIYEVELSKGEEGQARLPNAVFAIRLNKRQSHTKLMMQISEIDCVRLIEEV